MSSSFPSAQRSPTSSSGRNLCPGLTRNTFASRPTSPSPRTQDSSSSQMDTATAGFSSLTGKENWSRSSVSVFQYSTFNIFKISTLDRFHFCLDPTRPKDRQLIYILSIKVRFRSINSDQMENNSFDGIQINFLFWVYPTHEISKNESFQRATGAFPTASLCLRTRTFSASLTARAAKWTA
jgi:hypothetical protein